MADPTSQSSRFDTLIETVMLHPGSVAAARLLVGIRLFILLSSGALAVWFALRWEPAPELLLLYAGIELSVAVVTLLIMLAARFGSPALLRWTIVLSFLSDLTLALGGILSSGLTHSTMIVIPLLTLMVSTIILELRHTIICALFFALAYPLGSLAVLRGYWPLHHEPWTVGVAAEHSMLAFVISQELYFALALAAFATLVRKLRALYRSFQERLRSAVARMEAESRDRQKLDEKVRQSQKLESLGLLAGGVAHDFNNILVGIMGNAELTAMELPGDSRLQLPLQSIVSASRKAAELCQQMLTYSGQGNLSVTSLDLNKIIMEMPALLGAAIPRQARLSYDLTKELPRIEGDAAQLRQVAMNLIINAGEALKDGEGEVTVSSGTARFEHTLGESSPGENRLEWCPGNPDGEHVFFKVTDTGSGMDRDTLGRIFDPFFSTKFAGRGLGLSTVVGIVNAHQGLIRVVSRPGRGTEVTAAFPVSPSPLVRKTPLPRKLGHWRGSGRALLVDDDGSVREVVSLVLGRLGFQVQCASDGEEALARFREQPDGIDLVVCDLAMPIMQGDELARRLLELRPRTPFVLTSGFSSAELEKRLGKLPDLRFLQKPFSYQELMITIRSIMEPCSEGEPGRAPDGGLAAEESSGSATAAPPQAGSEAEPQQ